MSFAAYLVTAGLSQEYYYLVQKVCIHICHKLWTEICEIWQFFKRDSIKFCEIFAKITFELSQNNQKPLFKCKKLVINTKKCDLCLFLPKMCCKMVWNFCEIWKILWESTSRWAKFCEILSHSVRYGMHVHCEKKSFSWFQISRNNKLLISVKTM